MKRLVVAMLVVFVLSSCATTGGWFNDSNTNARIITKGITVEYLAHNKGSVDLFVQASTDALLYMTTGNITVGAIETGIRKAIAPSLEKMTPEGQTALLLFIDEAKLQLVKQLGVNNVKNPTEVVLETKTFIQWVHDAAVSYQAALTVAK